MKNVTKLALVSLFVMGTGMPVKANVDELRQYLGDKFSSFWMTKGGEEEIYNLTSREITMIPTMLKYMNDNGIIDQYLWETKPGDKNLAHDQYLSFKGSSEKSWEEMRQILTKISIFNRNISSKSAMITPAKLFSVLNN